jgi:hypothetical protein
VRNERTSGETSPSGNCGLSSASCSPPPIPWPCAAKSDSTVPRATLSCRILCNQ